MKQTLFSAKCIFRFLETEARRQIYEERIVLVRADNFDAAIQKAEKNSRKYCKNDNNCEFVGLVDVFELFDKKVDDKSEIFSSMQTNDLDPDDFISQFYPDVPDDCVAEGKAHRWFKKDDRLYACYHCRVISEAKQK